MLFRLTNALISFQTFINDTVAAFLDRYMTAYLNNNLNYKHTLDDVQVHVGSVLEALIGVWLHLKLEKCKFHREELQYLRLITTGGGVKIDTDKVAAIKN